jgi:hypothetical protein
MRVNLLNGHDRDSEIIWSGELADWIENNRDAFDTAEIMDLCHKLTYRAYRIGGGAQPTYTLVAVDLEDVAPVAYRPAPEQCPWDIRQCTGGRRGQDCHICGAEF